MEVVVLFSSPGGYSGRRLEPSNMRRYSCAGPSRAFHAACIESAEELPYTASVFSIATCTSSAA